MKKLLWITDPHLDHAVSRLYIDEFMDKLSVANHDGIVITGDIGQAKTAPLFLKEISEHSSCPVYFVLGNHDFYGGGISEVTESIQALCRESDGKLVWLSNENPIAIDDEIALVGQEGWGDGTVGDFDSRVG